MFSFSLRKGILANPLPHSLESIARLHRSSHTSLIPIVDSLASGFFLHRIRPEKGVIYIATGAVDDALWDVEEEAPMGVGCRHDSGASDGCTKAILDLILAPGRTSKRHCIPVRPHLAMNSPLLPDIQYSIHVKECNQYNNM